jgi:iron complex transport system ATP-binding protein
MSLDIEGLAFGYRRSRLFDGLDARDLRRGSVTAVVGPNGVGKSSLFQLVAGLLTAHGGSIRLDGHDVGRLPLRRRTERIFLLAQHVSIRAALSVFEVVLLARKGGRGVKAASADIERVEGVLDALGIEHLSDRTVSELSGGQQQLVALGQALVRDPDVLLLDEPTSALDLRRQLEVTELIRKVTVERGLVTVAALHDLGLASRFADRFLLLHDGRVANDGQPCAVLSSPAVERAYGVGIRLERTSRGTLVVEPYMS